MSKPTPQTSGRANVPVDARFDLNNSRITIGEKYTNVRIPIDVWNEEVEREKKNLNSRDTEIDPKAVAARMSVKIVRTAAVQTLVSQPDLRDDIPLVYSSKTRKIIHLVGFVLSSSAILGVHIAGNAGHVPGFQPLPFFPVAPDGDSDSPNILLGMAFGGLILVTLIFRAIAIWG